MLSATRYQNKVFTADTPKMDKKRSASATMTLEDILKETSRIDKRKEDIQRTMQKKCQEYARVT